MNDIYITLTGNVASEPRQYTFEDGVRVTSLRVLTSHRYFDKKTGQWTDGEKVCFAVRCWRTLADNVAQSIRVGHPVVVSGKLRIREFGPESDRRFMAEVEASSVGHDLRWGTGVFTKPERGTAIVSRERRDRLDEETQDWAMGSGRTALARLGEALPELDPPAWETAMAEPSLRPAETPVLNGAATHEPSAGEVSAGELGKGEATQEGRARRRGRREEPAAAATAKGDPLVNVLGTAGDGPGESAKERLAA
ncbi:single-stranded DNA-binding protein [Nonomuraea typhae]|uniref:Single-stranded DNA-binding protein n=1 Tax=Nonomuraea typhae TaxID=2603600 RepID=A0ABW7Z8S9_9ACTN